MVAYKYVVHSDVDENNIRDEFETANDAIEYAKSCPLEDKVWVELVEVELNDFGEVEDVYDHETIWSYADQPVEEVEDGLDFSVDDLVDDNKPESVDEDYIIAVKEVPNSDDFDGIDWADVDSCEADNYECCSEDEECEWPEPTSDISIVAKPFADPVDFVDDFSMDFPEEEKIYCPNCGKEICECTKQELTEADEEGEDDSELDPELEEEIPDDLFGQMDYLSWSEEKAIDEYNVVIDKVEDEHVANELKKIATEEQAHKDFVDKVKEDPTAEYVEPLETEEKEEEVSEDEEEIFEDEEDFEECLKESFSGEELNKLMELAPQVGIKTLGDLDAYMKKNNISEDELLGFMEAEVAKSDVPVDESLNEGIFDNLKIDKQAKKLTDKESCYYVKVVTDGNVDETNSKYFTKIADADKYAKAAAKKFAQSDVKIYLNNEAWLKTPLKGYKGNDTTIDQVERAINQIAQQKAEADAKVKQDKQAEKEAGKIEKQFNKAADKSVEAKKAKEVSQQEVKPEVKDELEKDADTSASSEANTADAEQTTSGDVKQETEVKPEPEVKKNADAVKARAEYNKILKALKAANIDTTKFVDGKKATQELKDLRKALFSESLDYNSMQEALEENEDEVECRGCYELFPKSSCVKTKHGYYCEACANSLKEELTEHINDRPADIESDQEYHGVDNAVVDCKKYTMVAHSEDEKPVDCNMEKPALEEPLAGEEVEVKVNK